MLHQDEVVLEHETRRMIYNHIVAYPGVSHTMLRKIFELTDGTLRYHLKYLEKGEKIKRVLKDGKRIYYPQRAMDNVQNIAEDLVGKYKLNQQQVQLLNTIKSFPGISQKELVKKTNMKRFVVTYNIGKLIDIGFVRKNNEVRNVSYEYIPDELLRLEMLKILTIKLLRKEIDERTYTELKAKLEE